MSNQPNSITFMHKSSSTKQNGEELLVTLVLTALTNLPAHVVELINTRIVTEGIRVHVTPTFESEMLRTLRELLAKSELELERSQIRAAHFQRELVHTQECLAVLTQELEDKRATLRFLEEGLASLGGNPQ